MASQNPLPTIPSPQEPPSSEETPIEEPIITEHGFSLLPPLPSGKYEIRGPGIRALFVPFTGALSNLFVLDKHGIERDVILGYDTPEEYEEKREGLRLGTVGRYASPKIGVSKAEEGIAGMSIKESHDWMKKGVTIAVHEHNTIMFNNVVLDKTHGQVASCFTWTAVEDGIEVSFAAMSVTKRGAYMLGSENYFNLDGFSHPEKKTVSDHTLSLPYSGLHISPSGSLTNNPLSSPTDFWSSPKKVDSSSFDSATLENGESCFVVNRQFTGKQQWRRDPVASLWSEESGIKLDVHSSEEAVYVQPYSPDQGEFSLKESQGKGKVEKGGAIKIKPGEWADVVSHPEWGRAERVYYGPDTGTYKIDWCWKFSLL